MSAEASSSRRRQVERWMPGVRVLRTYERAWLSRDLIAGIVLVTLLVPQGMAYAELAGLPPITGLYTTVVCLVAYAFVGPSPILVLGPDSSLGPMIAATILPLAAGDQQQAIALAGMLAILVGAITVGAGIARLGFVADLLSNPVRTGYLAGLAVVIFVGQLPKLFGFSTDAEGLVAEVGAFIQGLDQTNPWALGIGLLSLGIILGLKRLSPRTPGHPHRRRGRDRAVDRARPRRRTACRSSACCRRASRCPTLPGGAAGRHPAAVRRRASGSRSSPSATRSRPRAASPRAAATRSTATRSSPGSGRPTSPPACSRGSR